MARKQESGKSDPGKSQKTKEKAPGFRRFRRGLRGKRGTLFVLAALLVGSAILRVGEHAGEVFALDKPDSVGAEAHAGAMTAAAGCEPTPDVAAMLEAFKERESRLDAREAQIRDRMNALAVADEEIDKKLAQLETAEAKLRDTLALADNAAEKDITRLVAVYENMKPKDAAALFEQMEPQFAAGFLARMRPEAAAQVMTGLSSDAAYTISVVLAGRNSSVPKN